MYFIGLKKAALRGESLTACLACLRIPAGMTAALAPPVQMPESPVQAKFPADAESFFIFSGSDNGALHVSGTLT